MRNLILFLLLIALIGCRDDEIYTVTMTAECRKCQVSYSNHEGQITTIDVQGKWERHTQIISGSFVYLRALYFSHDHDNQPDTLRITLKATNMEPLTEDEFGHIPVVSLSVRLPG